MKDRKKWLQERQAGIGGSEIAAVCGLSQWRTPIDVWLEKTGPVEDGEATLAMELGNYLEPLIIKKYERETGHRVSANIDAITHERYKFARCNLDGFVLTSDDDKGILEVKTAGDSRKWGEPGSDQIPIDYYLQCQWNMLVAGVKWCDVPVLFFDRGRRIEIYHVTADWEIQQQLVEKAEVFWDCVVKDIMPEPRTGQEAEQVYAKHIKGESIQCDDALVQDIEMIKALKATLKDTEDAIKLCESRIKCAMKNAESVMDGDKTLVTWKTCNTSRVNTAALKRANPEICEAFTSTSSYRRFLVK